MILVICFKYCIWLKNFEPKTYDNLTTIKSHQPKPIKLNSLKHITIWTATILRRKNNQWTTNFHHNWRAAQIPGQTPRQVFQEKVSDRIKIANKDFLIKIAKMLKLLQMMSVKQIAAQIKLTEIWKAVNDSQYSLRVEQKIEVEDGIARRSISRGDRIEFSCTTNYKKSVMVFLLLWI